MPGVLMSLTAWNRGTLGMSSKHIKYEICSLNYSTARMFCTGIAHSCFRRATELYFHVGTRPSHLGSTTVQYQRTHESGEIFVDQIILLSMKFILKLIFKRCDVQILSGTT
jgi:hypothetical protein